MKEVFGKKIGGRSSHCIPCIPNIFRSRADASRGPRPCNAEDETTTYDKWITNWVCEDTRLGPCVSLIFLDLFSKAQVDQKKQATAPGSLFTLTLH